MSEAVLLELPPRVVAIDIGGTKVDIALADRSGIILDRLRIDTLAERGVDQVLSRIVDAVRTLLARAAQAGGPVMAACAAVTPGVVRANQVLFAPNLPGWDRVALADRLQDALGIGPVAVSNDVRAGALAELRAGSLRGADPGIYLSLGTGIGAALAVGDRVIEGGHGAAGEIAYMTGEASPVFAAADGVAPLELIAGGKAIGDRAGRYLGVPLTAKEVFADSHPVARQVVHEALAALATAVGNLAAFVDPQRVVIGGGLAADADTIIPVLTARLRQAVPFPPEVVPARFIKNASLHGAIALALDCWVPRPGPGTAKAWPRQTGKERLIR
jgi:glucokinase